VSDESKVEKVKTNAEIRQWYLEQVARIPELNEEWRQQGLPVKERAEMAWRVRHEARLQSRSMMADPAEVELLRARDMAVYSNPNGPTFEFLVEKLRVAGLEEDAGYEAIIEGAYRTDTGINKWLGV
jgi:hypothetical protein